MADIFISYSRSDRDRVSTIAHFLVSHGYSVWWDPDIETGADFTNAIHRELEAARHIIVVWSTASIASRWVRDEADDGLRNQKLLPVVIDAVSPPLGFRSLQTADLTDWRGEPDHPEIAKLVGILGARTSAPLPSAQERPKAAWRFRLKRKKQIAIAAVPLLLMAAGLAVYYAPTGLMFVKNPAPGSDIVARETKRQEEDLRKRLLLLSKMRKFPAKPFSLFTLAQRYEGYSPDHVGSDFAGNYYYGTYRINARSNMAEFLGFLRQYYPAFSQRLDAAGGVNGAIKGTEEFSRSWKDLAQAPDFATAQADFLERSSYHRLARRLALARNAAQPSKGGLDLDLARRSLALQAVMFSISVQYGSGTSLPIDTLKHAEKPDSLSDTRIIEELYKAREQITVYFPDIKSNDYVDLLKQRNELEKEDALHMLHNG